MQEITIRVAPDAAALYLAASAQDRRKLDAMLSLRLSEVALPNRPLTDVIREASREAQARDLTAELLQEILDDKSLPLRLQSLRVATY